MKHIFEVWVVVFGGLVAASGIWRLLLAMQPSDRQAPRWALAIPALDVVAGLGLSFWILAPGATSRSLTFLVGTGGIITRSYLGIAQTRRKNSAGGGAA
jgi:uncharacterized membrane protein HdeD (DUF308 family)